jgi:hypothetical protein
MSTFKIAQFAVIVFGLAGALYTSGPSAPHRKVVGGDEKELCNGNDLNKYDCPTNPNPLFPCASGNYDVIATEVSGTLYKTRYNRDSNPCKSTKQMKLCDEPIKHKSHTDCDETKSAIRGDDPTEIGGE